MKPDKKSKEKESLVEKEKMYLLEEACQLIKKTTKAKFDETVEISLKLGVNPKQTDQNVKGTVVLPHGTGKTKKVLVLAKGEKLKEAEASGADYVGEKELIDKISGGWLGFDVIVSTPDMMKDLSKLGKILGPRGLMPSPKLGTATLDVGKAVKEIKAGKIEFKVDSYGIIHAGVGKVSFPEQKLRENIIALIKTIIKLKPSAAKGQYLKSISISSTMGSGIKIDSTQKFS
ncbi:50S ribosomal protein L1 [bacterium]|nr:50S ribosomal protein L1 [bacterium]